MSFEKDSHGYPLAAHNLTEQEVEVAFEEYWTAKRLHKAEVNKAWRESHKEYVKELQRKYKAEHREELLEYYKQWRQQHPQYDKQRSREKVVTANMPQEWQLAQRQRHAKYRQEHGDERNAQRREKRAADRSLGVRPTEEQNEKARQYNQRWRANNKEKAREYSRKYKAKLRSECNPPCTSSQATYQIMTCNDFLKFSCARLYTCKQSFPTFTSCC